MELMEKGTTAIDPNPQEWQDSTGQWNRLWLTVDPDGVVLGVRVI